MAKSNLLQSDSFCMKKILLIGFFLLSISANAQKLPDFGFNKVRLAESDKTILAETAPVNSNPKAKANLFYYWYGANEIHVTQGGFSGKLLNGSYTEFYLNKNLEEQGSFKKGLKNGTWKRWNEDGTLNQVTQWKNGLILVKEPVLFWKKLNIFKRKKIQTAPDTTTKK